MAPVENTAGEKPHACPGTPRLKDYLLGRLSPAEIETIAAATEVCTQCQRTLDALETEADALLETIRDSGDQEPWLDEPQLDDLLVAAELAGAESLSQHRTSDAEASPHKGEPISPPRQVGQYLLVEVLGRGGMGAVYRAQHARLRRDVALKMLTARRLNDPSAMARFRREMEAVGRLHHANIVQALDAGEADGQPFLAMELLDGSDAAEYVRRHGPLEVARACDAARQACAGIAYAHGQGLLHRDVKPSNLMLSPDSTVKVLDLGLARIVEPTDAEDTALTSESHALGTGDFVAPEQGLDPRAADERSDVYALGCTLYYLLTGEPPYAHSRHNTFAKKVMAHVQEPVPAPSARNPQVPEQLDRIVQRAMAKQPGERFAAAQDFAEALLPFCDTDAQGIAGSSAGQLSAAQAATRQRTQRFALLAAVAATALVMLALFGITLAALPQLLGPAAITDVASSDGSPNEVSPDEELPTGNTPATSDEPVSDVSIDTANPEDDTRNSSGNTARTTDSANQPPSPSSRHPIDLQWIYTEHEGRKREPSGMLIQGQGFCFLSGVQGKFHGWADKVHVDVNKDNVWGVTGAGVEFKVDIKARAFSVETRTPRPLSVGVNAYRWSPPSDGVRMLHKDEGVCVLTSFVGGLKTEDEFTGIELRDDGFYWLIGNSADATSTALATSVLLSKERSLAAEVKTYRWPSNMHRQPIRMLHRDEGICFLSLIRGPFAKPEDAARVYLGDDGYWYLSGGGEESPVTAEAIAVQLHGDIVK